MRRSALQAVAAVKRSHLLFLSIGLLLLFLVLTTMRGSSLFRTPVTHDEDHLVRLVGRNDLGDLDTVRKVLTAGNLRALRSGVPADAAFELPDDRAILGILLDKRKGFDLTRLDERWREGFSDAEEINNSTHDQNIFIDEGEYIRFTEELSVRFGTDSAASDRLVRFALAAPILRQKASIVGVLDPAGPTAQQYRLYGGQQASYPMSPTIEVQQFCQDGDLAFAIVCIVGGKNAGYIDLVRLWKQPDDSWVVDANWPYVIY